MKKYINHPWVVAIFAGGFWWGIDRWIIHVREGLPAIASMLVATWEPLAITAFVFLLVSLARRQPATTLREQRRKEVLALLVGCADAILLAAGFAVLGIFVLGFILLLV